MDWLFLGYVPYLELRLQNAKTLSSGTLSLSLSLFLSLCLSLPLSLTLPLSLSVSISLSVCLCLSVSLSISLSLSLQAFLFAVWDFSQVSPTQSGRWGGEGLKKSKVRSRRPCSFVLFVVFLQPIPLNCAALQIMQAFCRPILHQDRKKMSLCSNVRITSF